MEQPHRLESPTTTASAHLSPSKIARLSAGVITWIPLLPCWQRRPYHEPSQQALVRLFQTFGIVPPSMTYSVPWIEEAREDARKATNSATSQGHAGRPMGMPPSASRMPCRAVSSSVPPCAAMRETIAWAAVVYIQPGETEVTRTPFGPNSFDNALL